MAWNSSRTGVAIAAFWVIVCVSPSAPAQEWVRWRGTPSLLDQDPAKRLPPAPQAQAPQARVAARGVVPSAETSAAARPVPRVEAVAVVAPAPIPPPALAAQPPMPAAPQTAAAGAVAAPTARATAELAPTARAPVMPAASAASPAATMATAAAPTRGAPAITWPAAADNAELEIAPLGADGSVDAATVAGQAPSRDAAPNAAPALAVAAVARAPRASGAYVTVGSDSDASVVAAAPQVYSCDESGRCEHLENELPSVGLQAAPGVERAPNRQIESEIKRSALRGF